MRVGGTSLVGGYGSKAKYIHVPTPDMYIKGNVPGDEAPILFRRKELCVYPPPPCPDNRAMSTRVLSKTLKWKLGSLSSPVATPR